ncbi:unnamed protein product [Lepeophtheirus salmonis]|uniref:(salmon louse) hypothetical protein n=1 Tax=Lepeophtheirus salmonis TaxID=72036 RepID=A0A7R8CUQ9_LEPSM|nr:unnamed protein product [Lepeophtheirus salmonis]CAF2902414.1 unnamed protein product [Lepeophtheirus salmonis]
MAMLTLKYENSEEDGLYFTVIKDVLKKFELLPFFNPRSNIFHLVTDGSNEATGAATHHTVEDSPIPNREVSSGQQSVEASAILLSEFLHPLDAIKNTVLPCGGASNEEARVPHFVCESRRLAALIPQLFEETEDILMVLSLNPAEQF